MSNKGDGKKGPSPVGGGAGPSRAGGSRSPEEPTMRAVAIMGAPTLLRHSHAEIPRSERFVGLSPVSLKKEAPAGFSVKQEWKGKVAVPSSWVVKTESLEMASFPLERTHREIEGVEAEVVCSRISEVLRSLSIEAEYDDEKGKVKCRTQDYACFRIRLYAGSEAGQPVVVELQRRSGPATSFMQSCRSILCAAEGKTARLPEKKAPPFMKCPVASMKCLQGVMPQVDRRAELRSGMSKVMELLRKDQHDSSVLAMENLCHLTDPIKTFPATALGASKTIFEADEALNVREEISSLLERDGVSPDFDHDVAVGGQDQADRLRHLALLVFSNALSLTAKDGSLEHSIEQERWFEEFLIPTLMDEVRSAKTSPNNASVASGCLVSLMSCSAVARGLVREYDGLQVIGEAREHGLKFHELLANETERCMKALEATN